MANAGSRVTFSGIDGINFNLIDGMGSFGQFSQQLEEIGKQNMELFTKAFSMFTPFTADTAKKK